jgi:hypothetical protein
MCAPRSAFKRGRSASASAPAQAGTELLSRLPIQPIAYPLTRLKTGKAFFGDGNTGTTERIASNPRLSARHGKNAKAAQFDPITAGQRRGDFGEHRIDNRFDVSLGKMRIALVQP